MSTVLDPEQEQVLEFLVEAYRRSSERQPFYAAQPANSHNLHLAHAGVPRDHPGIYPADIQTLSEAGLLRLERPDHSTWRFDLTPAAFRYYAKKALCEAMVAYWGEVADFAQRQEHGAQKEGQALEWEDGRMLVFHTLFTMVELDRISK